MITLGVGLGEFPCVKHHIMQMNSLQDDGSSSHAAANAVNAVGEANSPSDEEAAIKCNCDNFNDFLVQLKTRNYKGQCEDTIKALAELKRNMSEYLSEEITDNNVNNKKANGKSNQTDDQEYEFKKHISKSKTNNRRDKSVKSGHSKVKSRMHSSQSSSSSSSEELQKETDSMSSTSDGSSGSEESEVSNTKSGAKRKRKIKRKTELSDFAEVLLKLDNRMIPQQDKFDEESGRDFLEYIEQFEEYCQTNFKGHQNLWISELGRHLQGKMLQNYYLLKESCRSYQELKSKLVVWYTDNQEIRSRKCRKKFENAQIKANESVYLYSVRLESLFRVAFPSHSVKRSRTLLSKFKSSIPNSTKHNLKSTIMHNKMRDKEITWKEVQKWARLQDIEEESNDEINKQVKEVTINMSDSPQLRPQSNRQPGNINSSKNQVNRSRQPTTSHIRANSRNRQNWLSTNIQRYPYNAKCPVCHRFGHDSSNCRTRRRECFICGDPQHFIKDCPRYYRNKNRYSFNQQSQPAQCRPSHQQFTVPERRHSMTRYSNEHYRQQQTGHNSSNKFKQPRRSLSQSFINRNDKQPGYKLSNNPLNM